MWDRRNHAKELVKFLTDGIKVKQYCNSDVGTILPADTAYYNDKDLINKPYMKIFSKQLEYSKMTPVHPKWLDIEASLEKAAESMLLGQKTAKDALIIADSEIKLILQK